MPGVRNDHSIELLQAVVAPLAGGFVLWLIARLAQRTFRNLPPGPKGLPIVGDVFHIADQDWLASPKRKDEYGQIPHTHCLKKPRSYFFFFFQAR
jgi:hypothetical protein